jgi:hypothetical protein
MKKTKILALFLALTAFGLISPAKAQFAYVDNGGAVTITGYTGPGGVVTIPDTINNDPVTGIGPNAFLQDYSLTSITIGTNVTSIGKFAFNQCLTLTNITVIAGNPDYSSTNGVLFNLNQTLLIQYPEALGDSYTIPNSVTNLEDSAFDECYKLTNITIPNSVTSIGEDMFALCFSLTNIIIPNSVTSMGNYTFASCLNLTSATVGNSVTSIGTNAFYQCFALTSITIPNSVTSIGQEAFIYCSNLTSVTIGNGVTNIGQFAFLGCPSLTNLTVSAGNPDYSTANGVLFDLNQTLLIQYPEGLGGSYTIPNSVTSIGQLAFEKSPYLTSVTIGNDVTNVGQQAFYDCSSLTNLTFLGNAPGLGDVAFSGVASGATVYYYYGTSGWGATYGGLPTVGLFMPPQISGAGGNVGVSSGNFSFSVSGVSNQTIIVQASTNLVNWQPIWTNTLSGTATNFNDPQWKNYPSRFYRAQ